MSKDGVERRGGIAPGFEIRGIDPQRNIYDFEISIDAEFADELRGLDVPDEQEGAADHIVADYLTHDMADVRFVGDSFLLRGITVGFQATGLDLHKEERGRQRYATHNVDASSEATEIIAAFSRWHDLAKHLLEDRREDDGLRADGSGEPDDDPFDDGEMWSAAEHELEAALADYYGAENLWLQDDSLVHYDGDEIHVIDDDVPLFGHGPSGAVCVKQEYLPSQEEVDEVVR